MEEQFSENIVAEEGSRHPLGRSPIMWGPGSGLLIQPQLCLLQGYICRPSFSCL